MCACVYAGATSAVACIACPAGTYSGLAGLGSSGSGFEMPARGTQLAFAEAGPCGFVVATSCSASATVGSSHGFTAVERAVEGRE
jgi:hypothetical protein